MYETAAAAGLGPDLRHCHHMAAINITEQAAAAVAAAAAAVADVSRTTVCNIAYNGTDSQEEYWQIKLRPLKKTCI